MVGALGLLLFPLGEKVAEAPALKQESQNSDTNSGDIKDIKPETQHEEKTSCIQSRKISVSQIAAAVAALHERSLLENKINGSWFSRHPRLLSIVICLRELRKSGKDVLIIDL